MADITEISSKVFLDTKSNLFFLRGDLENCENIDCQLPHFVGDTIFLKITWSKVKSKLNLFCQGCMIKSKDESQTYEVLTLNIVDAVPKEFIPYFPSVPVLIYTKTHAEAIYDNIDAEIIDHTRYSGKENFTFSMGLDDKRERIPLVEMQDTVAVQSGNETIHLAADVAHRINSDDRRLQVPEIFAMLDSIRDEYVLLDKEGNKIKQLEFKEE